MSGGWRLDNQIQLDTPKREAAEADPPQPQRELSRSINPAADHPFRAEATSPFRQARRMRNYWANHALRESISCPRRKALGYLKESALIERAQKGDIAARNLVWRSNLRLAMSAVNHFHVPEDLVPDAFQEAAIGLETAIRRFEVRRFLAFSTYAWYWMCQRVHRFLQSQRFGTRIPAHLYKPFARFCKDRRTFESNGDWFDWLMNWKEQDHEAFERLLRLYLITHPVMLDSDAPVASEGTNPEHSMAAVDASAIIRETVAVLNERDQAIFRHRFGLDGHEVLTLEALGLRYDLTRERVRQIQKGVLGRLRRRLGRVGWVFPQKDLPRSAERDKDSGQDG